VFRYNEELFDTPSWIAVMLGQGIVPAESDPLVTAMPEAQVIRAMGELKQSYEAAASRLPLASEFIARRVSGP
jgi:tryptophan halogenase